jgi:hypothetical protein
VSSRPGPWLRAAGWLGLAALAGVGTFAVARRALAPGTASASESPSSTEADERAQGLAALAGGLREVARRSTALAAAPETSPVPAADGQPLQVRGPELSDLDRLTLTGGEPWDRLQKDLTLAVSERLGNHCARAQRHHTLIDVYFQGTTTESGLVASRPRFVVREGAPLSPAAAQCLEVMLSEPLGVPRARAAQPAPFEGEARTTLTLGV